jgi:hypothetical protein
MIMRNHVLCLIQLLVLLAAALLAPAIPQESGRTSAAGGPRSPQAHIASPPSAAVIDAPAVELVGSFGGAPTTLAISGTLAYVGEGAGLAIVDVSNPDLPVRLARMTLPGARQVRLNGNRAYVRYGSQLTILDISVPNNPLSLGSYSLPVTPSDFQIAGKFAYAVYGNEPRYFGTDPGGGLEIIDVSDPAHPALRGSYWASSWAGSIAVANGYAYIATISGLQVVDVRNPAQPVLRSTYVNEHYEASYIQIEHAFAYVIFSGGDAVLPYYHLDILDVSDPDHVKLRGKSSDVVNVAHQLQVSGSQAYISEGFCRLNCGYALAAIDASDPANLKTSILQGLPNLPIFAVREAQFYAIVEDTLTIFDLNGTNTPAPRGSCSLSSSSIYSVQVVGQRAYALGSAGLEIIDISDPSRPELLGRAPAGVTGLSIHNQFAYVVDGPKLQIFDISDPGNPTPRGTFAVSDTLQAIDSNNNFAYLVSDGKLSIVDVDNVDAPVLRGTYVLTHGLGQDIQVDGTYAYLATGGDLDIVDVGDPLGPKLLSSVQAPLAQSIFVAGNRAYTAARGGGVQIFDVSDPTAPLLRGGYTPLIDAMDVQAGGDLIYIADSNAVRIVDVRDPAGPLPRAAFATVDNPRRIQVVGDLIYVADAAGGLLILRVHPERFPEPMFLPVIGHAS